MGRESTYFTTKKNKKGSSNEGNNGGKTLHDIKNMVEILG